MRTSLLIVSKQTILLESIKSILSAEPDFDVRGEASSAVALGEMLRLTQPEILVVDICFSKQEDVVLSDYIKMFSPLTKVVIFGLGGCENCIFKLVDNGTAAYIPVEAKPAKFIDIIKIVRDGSTYFDERISKKIVKGFVDSKTDWNQYPKVDQLSKREKEILTFIAQGLSSKEISDKLFISPRTVDTHRANIMTKLEARNRVDLTRMAIRCKLL